MYSVADILNRVVGLRRSRDKEFVFPRPLDHVGVDRSHLGRGRVVILNFD